MLSMSKHKSAGQAVTESRARTGAKTVAITLSAEQKDMLDRLTDRWGGVKATLVAGLHALDAGAPAPTPEEALRVIEDLVRNQKTGGRQRKAEAEGEG